MSTPDIETAELLARKSAPVEPVAVPAPIAPVALPFAAPTPLALPVAAHLEAVA